MKVEEKDRDLLTSSLRKLLESMMEYNPEKRLTLDEVKKSEWYNEKTLEEDEYKNIMEEKFKKIERKK